MTIEDVEDHVRKYTVEEEERLALQLRSIIEDVHRGQMWPPTLESMCEMHRRLFSGVRAHAGRPRARAFGDEHLVFGPNRSVHRDEVAAELQSVFRDLERSVASFLAHPDDPSYERSAVHVAVWVHAQIVRIHPFLDGNGRTSRMVMNTVLVGLGLRPIAVEAVKQEYNEALNVYFRTDSIDLLIDLMLRLID